MFINILKISASNVLKMLFKHNCWFGRAVVIFIRTNQPEAQIPFTVFVATLAGKKAI